MQKEASDRLGKTTITDIFEHGLHEFITEFLATNRLVADAIAADYRFTE